MKNVLKLGACIICALFMNSAMATENHTLILAADKTEAKDAHKVSDSDLAKNVREEFVKQKLFGKEKFSEMGLHVTVKKGVVTLSGHVASKDDMEKAVSVANGVEGVKSVESKIKVKEEKKSDEKEKK